MLDQDQTDRLIDQVRMASDQQSPVRIVGGNSKSFLGQRAAECLQLPEDALINTSDHSGIVGYEPTELVVTVRSGTSVASLVALLAEQGQMLPFEPPELNGGTIGGVLACGLSGPARPFVGAARDFVLGMHVINAKAQRLQFGGEVMKNVAGYDAARLHVGAYGSLGLLTQMSMKVLPLPEAEVTLEHELATAFDTTELQRLCRQPLPITAAVLEGKQQRIRLSGSEAAVQAAASLLGGEQVTNASQYWESITEMSHAFFQDSRSLWRLSVPEFAELTIEGDCLYDWAGAQRFYKTDAPASEIFEACRQVQGHASCYSSKQLDADVPAFQPIDGTMARLQSRVRDSFDPHRLFNRGLFHPELDSSRAGAATSGA